MDKLIKIILGLYIILSFSSCTSFEQKIRNEIKSDSKNYNKLVESIYQCDLSRFSYNQYISKEYFPKELNEAIDSTILGDKIEYLEISQNSDCDRFEIELISHKIHLRYEPCPSSDFPKPDFYEKEGLIERWGINKNWMIYKNHDFVY